MDSPISVRSLLSWLLQIALLLGPLDAVARGKTAAEVVAELQKLPANGRQAFLEAGAKKEGSLVLYGTTAVDHQHKISLAFRRRYPFLEVKLYRAGTTALLRKIMTEARAGRLEADVINIAPGAAYEVKRMGLIEKYRSPNRKYLREGMTDKDGFYTAWQHIIVLMTYNTQLVQKEEAPKSYEDLLDPKWKGKIHLDSQDADWFHTLLEYWGEEKGLAYMKKLAANEVQVRTGHTLGAQLLAAGEFYISPVLYDHRVHEMMQRGAPMNFVLIDPVISKPRGMALAKKGAHPHAAILYLDWIISKEAQTIVGQKLGRNPVRKGMTSKYGGSDHPQYVTVNGETLGPAYKKRLRQYNEIFKFR